MPNQLGNTGRPQGTAFRPEQRHTETGILAVAVCVPNRMSTDKQSTTVLEVPGKLGIERYKEELPS